MLVEPGVQAPAESLSSLGNEPVPADAVVIVGPEGGWEEGEWVAARSHGVRLVSLGQRTLRADAVPVAVLSVLAFLWDEPRH
jgi:RsmE family RNA methyltransferase